MRTLDLIQHDGEPISFVVSNVECFYPDKKQCVVRMNCGKEIMVKESYAEVKSKVDSIGYKPAYNKRQTADYRDFVGRMDRNERDY